MTALAPEHAKQLAELLKLFGQAQRLQILSLLAAGPCAVNEIEARTHIGQPTLSQQLGTLRRAGIIAAQRESRTTIYSLADEYEARRTRTVLGLLEPADLPRDRTGPAKQERDALPRPTESQAGAQFARIKPPAARS